MHVALEMIGEQKKDLSRFVLVAWLFFALIITSSYTASLSSLLTAERLRSTTVDVDTLRRSGAVVGCSGRSFVYNYLIDVLEFNPNNIRKIYSEHEYREALMNGEIKAAFLEVPYVKVFLARYCGFTTTPGPSFRVGGFGFAFPKNSPYLHDISEAVVRISETGKLRELEISLTASYNCSSFSSSSTGIDHGSLDVKSFLGIIVISGGISTFALIFFLYTSRSSGQNVQHGQNDQTAEEQQTNQNQ